jgi:LysM repeat protein
MKLPILIRRKKKLRASTARRSLALPEADYEEMSEPNMKLSRALLIVLVLHVVAVAGIIAFNTIKTRQGSLPQSAVGKSAKHQVANETAANTVPVVAPPTKASAKKGDDVKPTHLSNTEVAKAHQSEPAKTRAESHESKVEDSGKTYIVVKGDNPVTIARHLNVSYDDLMELNRIEDPRKLQIGQKLAIPAKRSKSKKDD